MAKKGLKTRNNEINSQKTEFVSEIASQMNWIEIKRDLGFGTNSDHARQLSVI